MQSVKFTYTNYKLVTEERHVIPRELYFGVTPVHTEPQWLLRAFDLVREAPRTFAMSSLSNWRAVK